MSVRAKGTFLHEKLAVDLSIYVGVELDDAQLKLGADDRTSVLT